MTITAVDAEALFDYFQLDDQTKMIKCAPRTQKLCTAEGIEIPLNLCIVNGNYYRVGFNRELNIFAYCETD